jgi:hypothetical protein
MPIMSDLTEDAKAEIKAAFAIVREDKHHSMLRKIAKNTEPKAEIPTPEVPPVVDPPKPPAVPATPPVVEPPPPKTVTPPVVPPVVEKRRSAYWGDLDD